MEEEDDEEISQRRSKRIRAKGGVTSATLELEGASGIAEDDNELPPIVLDDWAWVFDDLDIGPSVQARVATSPQPPVFPTIPSTVDQGTQTGGKLLMGPNSHHPKAVVPGYDKTEDPLSVFHFGDLRPIPENLSLDEEIELMSIRMAMAQASENRYISRGIKHQLHNIRVLQKLKSDQDAADNGGDEDNAGSNRGKQSAEQRRG